MMDGLNAMPQTNTKDDTNDSPEKDTKKRGWDEIESLFDTKKAKTKQDQKDEDAAASKRKKNKKKTIGKPAPDCTRKETSEWVDDGLGGRYNGEGFTGRVQDGVKVFKAHLLSKPNAGNTPECPFDCDCCFI